VFIDLCEHCNFWNDKVKNVDLDPDPGLIIIYIYIYIICTGASPSRAYEYEPWTVVSLHGIGYRHP